MLAMKYFLYLLPIYLKQSKNYRLETRLTKTVQDKDMKTKSCVNLP